MKKIFLLPATLILLLFLSACGTKSESELLESAQMNIKSEKYAEALNDFKMILEKYPDGENASTATLEIGKLYHGKVVKDISVTESLNKAVEYYETFFEKYPDNEDAPQALFMAGFILANELKKYDEASKAYNKFLEKYPNNELAFSAKSELDNLGKDPEEILQKNSKTKQ